MNPSLEEGVSHIQDCFVLRTGPAIWMIDIVSKQKQFLCLLASTLHRIIYVLKTCYQSTSHLLLRLNRMELALSLLFPTSQESVGQHWTLIKVEEVLALTTGYFQSLNSDQLDLEIETRFLFFEAECYDQNSWSSRSAEFKRFSMRR